MLRGLGGYGPVRSVVASILLTALIASMSMLGGCSRPPEGAEAINWTDKARKSVDPSLFKAVEGYWASRVREDWSSAWQWEAPHIRFLWGKSAYISYFGRASRIIMINMKDIRMKHPRVRTICMEIRVLNPRTDKEESVYPCEDWVNVGDGWYHVFRQPFKKGF